jgi:DNA repair exonuclease SbcCD ATPase subunit
MLNQITLTSFAQHEDLTIDFTKGMNTIRGANEAGKSRLLQAINYALFGARTLKQPLEDLVTWGTDVKRLKVALTVTVDGDTYTFTRRKGGAEVTHQGKVFVTGQAEVSSFAASLLGADAATSAKLLFAGQNNIRGALEEGTAALSTLIEDLGGFDTFDTLMEAANTKLVTGSPTLIESRLAAAKNTLAGALGALPPKPDAESHRAEIEALTATVTAAQASVEPLREAAESAIDTWKKASERYMQRTHLERNVQEAGRTLEAAQKQVASLSASPVEEVDTSLIVKLSQRIADSEAHAERVKAYESLRALPHVEPKDVAVVPTSRVDLENRIGILAERLRATEKTYRELEFSVRALKQKRFNSDTCSKCGQKLPNADDIARRNAEVDAEIAEVVAKMQPMEADYDYDEQCHKSMVAFSRKAQDYLMAVSKLGHFVELVPGSTYPPLVKWVGDVPTGEPESIPELRKQITNIEAASKAVAALRAKLEMALDNQRAALGAFAAAKQELETFECPDTDQFLEIAKAKDDAVLAHEAAKGTVILTRKEIDDKVSAFDSVTKLWDALKAMVTEAEKNIAEHEADLASLSFNNGLVKKLRAIRPVIASRLWNTVLSSVSVMFTSMRRTESLVTKGKTGFMVNGMPVESLSGSTLDILGLALRCALLRTFIPRCGLLVLDEPQHGCDADRSEAMLGFLKSIGFDQTILVTHDPVSETVADNLIQL